MHRNWTAADGTSVVIRPITPDDLSLTEQFDRELSPQSMRRRLLSDRRLTSAELRRFTAIDPQREIALIGVVGRPGDLKQVGVARCVADQAGESAEFAIVVSDDWQHRGLGAVLLSALIDAARLHGLRRIEAVTMVDNQGMLTLARKLGFTARPDPGEDKLIELALDLV
jgi:acetyltransferase